MRSCTECGNPVARRATTCSVACRQNRSRRRRADIPVGTSCSHGHVYTADNTHIRPDGRLRCLTCHAEQKAQKRKQKQKKLGRACVCCGGAIEPSKNLGTKYCSPACSRRHRTGAHLKSCAYCGKATWRAKYCCKACRLTHYAATRRPHTCHKYGLTVAQYEQILANQRECCRICHRRFTDDLRPVIDHCHASGRVRGILCDLCNRALGQFKDDPTRLRAAIEYLEAA